MFFNSTRYERGSQFANVFEKDDPKLPTKRKVLNNYEEEEAPVEFVSKVEDNSFQQKDQIETLQAMEIPLSKALREEKFGHELQQMFSLFSSDLYSD